MTVVSILTGASLFEAGLVAPGRTYYLNGFWYYILDKIWTNNFKSKSV